LNVCGFGTNNDPIICDEQTTLLEDYSLSDRDCVFIIFVGVSVIPHSQPEEASSCGERGHDMDNTTYWLSGGDRNTCGIFVGQTSWRTTSWKTKNEKGN
jgi:hypothetical protein